MGRVSRPRYSQSPLNISHNGTGAPSVRSNASGGRQGSSSCPTRWSQQTSSFTKPSNGKWRQGRGCIDYSSDEDDSNEEEDDEEGDDEGDDEEDDDERRGEENVDNEGDDGEELAGEHNNASQSCKSKWDAVRKRIIEEMKNPASEINISILTVRTTKKATCEKIWAKYAPEFEQRKVVNSVGRLLLQRTKKEGPFSENQPPQKGEKDKPIWRTRSAISEGYGLLYKLRLYSKQGSGTENVSAEEIYKHHRIFHQYDFEDFKKWDKAMIKLTNKHRKIIEEQVALFEFHHSRVRRKKVTSRGKHFWRHHPARDFLVEDTHNGNARSLKPIDLWTTRVEYQDFSLKDFRKHIYQEKYRQLAGPYWQQKRNKTALKEHEDRVNKMYQEWLDAKWEEDMNEIAQGLASF